MYTRHQNTKHICDSSLVRSRDDRCLHVDIFSRLSRFLRRKQQNKTKISPRWNRSLFVYALYSQHKTYMPLKSFFMRATLRKHMGNYDVNKIPKVVATPGCE